VVSRKTPHQLGSHYVSLQNIKNFFGGGYRISPLQEDHSLTGFEKRVMQGIFGPKRDEGNRRLEKTG